MTEIAKVIITGGHETGGLQSFASTLADGFLKLGLPVEVIAPGQIYSRMRDLRDPSVLKILSTTAVYAAPLSRRAICVAHGFPRPDAQGWVKVFAILASLRMACASTRSCLVAVSFYAATHLKAIYNIDVAEVIYNPLHAVFFAQRERAGERCYLTFVGRLHPVKNIHKLLPAMQKYLNSCPGLEIRIVGDGPLRACLEEQFGHDRRIQFVGSLEPSLVRDVLRKTKVFLSGAETESFGIAYLEALSQGCSVVMPASGGGLEIVPELIGSKVQIVPLSFDTVALEHAIHEASQAVEMPVRLTRFAADRIASQYLQLGQQLT